MAKPAQSPYPGHCVVVKEGPQVAEALVEQGRHEGGDELQETAADTSERTESGKCAVIFYEKTLELGQRHECHAQSEKDGKK